jgi:hypothetical protein
VWFRRARLLIVSPDSRANLARRQAETPLIALFRFPEPALRFHTWVKVLLVIIVLGLCIYAINQFRSITGGEPSKEAANILLYWAAAVFAPIGFLIELAGLKFADK